MRLISTTTIGYKVLSTLDTPYNVNGNEGVTHRLILMDLGDGDVEKVKVADKDVLNKFEIGKTYKLVGQTDARGGSTGEWKVIDGIPVVDNPKPQGGNK